MYAKKIGTDCRLILSLYLGLKVKFRLDVHGEACNTDAAQSVRRTVSQRGIGRTGDFKIGGQIIDTIRYADDLVLQVEEEA